MSDITVEKLSSLEEIALHLNVCKDTLDRWIAKKIFAHKTARLCNLRSVK